MPKTNPASQILQMPKSRVGAYALDLANLAAKNIPLPVSFSVPVSTFQQIAEFNFLDKKFTELCRDLHHDNELQLQQALTSIRLSIIRQKIPDHVQTKLFTFYEDYLAQDFIRLTASPINDTEAVYKREDNIRGEANLLESLLTLWSKNITINNLLEKNLYPIAVVIQSQSQPTVSGLAFTQNPENGDKTQFFIEACWGVYSPLQKPDYFGVDQRSWDINKKELQIQKTYLKRNLDQLEEKPLAETKQKQPCLTDEQILELSKLIKKVKLNHFNQLKIHWELHDDNIILTKIKPFHFQQGLTQETKTKHKLIALGKPVTSGFITGQVYKILNRKDIYDFPTGEITCVKQLTNDHERLLHHSSAILCEKSIKSHTLLKKIRQYQLPVVIQINNLFEKIKNKQLITVDANSGKIYRPQINLDNTLQQRPNTGLFLAVNQPTDVTPELNSISEGIGLLRSGQYFFQTGKHPNYIIHSKKNRKQLKNEVVQELINFYHRYNNQNQRAPFIAYRSMDLTTRQLAKLSHSGCEPNEKNPYLGFRGGLRHLSNPDIFTFELEVLAEINERLDRQIILLLPFIRTAFELKQIMAIVKQRITNQVFRPQVWLQVNTPENLFNLKQYFQSGISGLSVNIKGLHGLFHGIDPDNRDVIDHYSTDNKLIIDILHLLKKEIDQCPHKINTLINLYDYNEDLLEACFELNFMGVTVRPSLARQTKEKLVLFDKKIINHVNN